MIILPQQQFLWVNLAGASVTALPFTISYKGGSTDAAQNGVTSGATAVAMNVSAPPDGICRVYSFSVQNPNAASHIVTISRGTTSSRTLVTACLLTTGDTLNYEEGSGFFVTDSNGSVKTATSGIVTVPINPSDINLTNTHIIVGDVSNLGADVAMSGDATMANTGALTLANTAVTPSTYGGSTSVSVITVDSKGRITGATSTAISFPADFITAIADTSTIDLILAAGSLTAVVIDASITYAKIQNVAANKMLVNNTSGATSLAETPYFDAAEAAYVGTPAWTAGTAPAGATTHTFTYKRIGSEVNLKIWLIYATPGATCTQVIMPLPAGAPTPRDPSGLGAAGDKLYSGSGWIDAALTGAPPASRAWLRVNAGDTGYDCVVIATSSSANCAHINIWYEAA